MLLLNLINRMKCEYNCCGEEGSIRCMDSCDNVDCSSDEDCGDSGCCSNGKCNDPKSDCDSSQTPTIPCSDEICPSDCCIAELGICQTTGLGCLPQNSNCSLKEACASRCCYEGKCRDPEAEVYSNDDDEQPIISGHEDFSGSRSDSTVHIGWKTPVIVIAVIIVVGLKIALLVAWAMRRSRTRVVVVRAVLAPTSTVQVGHRHASDVVVVVVVKLYLKVTR